MSETSNVQQPPLPVPPRARWRAAAAMLPDLLRLLRDLSRDPRVPRRAKLLGLAAAAYLAVPLDLIPDAIPVLGAVDDAVVVVLALRKLVAAAGYDLVRELWAGTDDGFALLIVLTGVQR